MVRLIILEVEFALTYFTTTLFFGRYSDVFATELDHINTMRNARRQSNEFLPANVTNIEKDINSYGTPLGAYPQFQQLHKDQCTSDQKDASQNSTKLLENPPQITDLATTSDTASDLYLNNPKNEEMEKNCLREGSLNTKKNEFDVSTTPSNIENTEDKEAMPCSASTISIQTSIASANTSQSQLVSKFAKEEEYSRLIHGNFNFDLWKTFVLTSKAHYLKIQSPFKELIVSFAITFLWSILSRRLWRERHNTWKMLFLLWSKIKNYVVSR